MSINGSDRERTFTFYQKYNKGAVADLLGFEVDKIKLEKSFGRYKVDLYGIFSERRLEVYFENQITPSDQAHLVKVINLINGIQEGIIIWVALKFNSTHLQSVERELKGKRQKYINIYFVELAQDVLDYVSWLDKQFKLHILDNLGLLNQVKEPMRLVYKIENIPKTFVGHANVDDRKYDLRRKEDIFEYTLSRLQEKIPFYPNLHYGRQPKKGDLSIHIGTGKDGLTYICCVENGKRQAFVKLYFAKHRKKMFDQFRSHLPSLQQQIHSQVTIKDREISLYFKPYPELDDTIDLIANVLKRMIYYFAHYLYRR